MDYGLGMAAGQRLAARRPPFRTPLLNSSEDYVLLIPVSRFEAVILTTILQRNGLKYFFRKKVLLL